MNSKTEKSIRESLKDKKRVVIKIGSSSLVHKETGRLDLPKIETLAREVIDIRNQGKDVCIVSSGAGVVGRTTLGIGKASTLQEKQAIAAVGQVRLMMIYQKYFAEYGQNTAQILMTKQTMLDQEGRVNARNTFEELFSLGVIPIVNENDTRILTDCTRMIRRKIRRLSLSRRWTSSMKHLKVWRRMRRVTSAPAAWQRRLKPVRSRLLQVLIW